MNYEDIAINDAEIPLASTRIFQHILKTYASEVNKLNSVWHGFTADDLSFNHIRVPAPFNKSSSTNEHCSCRQPKIIVWWCSKWLPVGVNAVNAGRTTIEAILTTIRTADLIQGSVVQARYFATFKTRADRVRS